MHAQPASRSCRRPPVAPTIHPQDQRIHAIPPHSHAVISIGTCFLSAAAPFSFHTLNCPGDSARGVFRSKTAKPMTPGRSPRIRDVLFICRRGSLDPLFRGYSLRWLKAAETYMLLLLESINPYRARGSKGYGMFTGADTCGGPCNSAFKVATCGSKSIYQQNIVKLSSSGLGFCIVILRTLSNLLHVLRNYV